MGLTSLPAPVALSSTQGVVASATVTAIQSGITAAVDLTGFTVSPMLVAGHQYRITFWVTLLQSAIAGQASWTLLVAGATVAASNKGAEANEAYPASLVYFLTGAAAGTTVIKMQLGVTAGTIGTSVSATAPGLLLVEDITSGSVFIQATNYNVQGKLYRIRTSTREVYR